MPDAVIVSTARTPIGKAYRGAFNMTHGADLGGHVISHAVERAGVDPGEVEDVVMGCALPGARDRQNIARQAAIRAGLPVTVGGMTVNRFCSSGLQAIALAAQRIIAGEARSSSPAGSNASAWCRTASSIPAPNEWLLEHKPAIYMPMIETADIVAERYGVSREAQDEYALESQRRTAAGAAGQALRRRDRAAADDQEGRGQGHQGREPRAGDAQERRRQPARHDARRARRAQAGARRQIHHGRQCEPAFRRRLGLRAHGREARGAARAQAARHLPRLRRRRLRARRDGHRPGVRRAQAARAPRAQDRRYRPLGAQRGVRQPGALLPRPARHSAGAAQRRWRRDLDRPSLRHERRAHDRPRPDRRPAPRRQARASSRCASAAAWAPPACSRSTNRTLPGTRHGSSLHARRDRLPRRGARVHAQGAAAADPRQDGRGAQPRQGRHRHLAAHPQCQGLGGAALAGRVGRHRLEPGADLSFPRRDAAGAGAGAAAVRRQHGRARSSSPSAARRRSNAFCRASPISTIGGARASPSPAPAPTSPRSRPRRSATATIMSSTARRPGRRWRNMPTGSSAWCAPIRRRRSRRASPSC